MQLVTLVPGVSGGQDEGFVRIQFLPYSFNGGRLEYNNWEVDGGDILDNGSNQTLNVHPSIDAIAEARVLTSNYGARYGRNGSGTVETETKSGTNKFHGDAHEFVRNELFDARIYFDPPGPLPAYKKNDFGYTLGGPIYVPGVYNKKKDKIFSFWSQEYGELAKCILLGRNLRTAGLQAHLRNDFCIDDFYEIQNHVNDGLIANRGVDHGVVNGAIRPFDAEILLDEIDSLAVYGIHELPSFLLALATCQQAPHFILSRSVKKHTQRIWAIPKKMLGPPSDDDGVSGLRSVLNDSFCNLENGFAVD